MKQVRAYLCGSSSVAVWMGLVLLNIKTRLLTTLYYYYHIIVTAAKADEAAQKRREKQELLAAEEAGTSIKVKAKVISGKKKKKTDDLSLLQDALVSSAEKKTKAKKRQEEEKLLAEQRLQQEKLAKAAIPMDPLLQNTEQMLQVEAGRSVNKAIMEEGATSGLDAALQSLNVGGGATEAKSQKALYKEFEERMLPVVKEDYPGLRLTQYKEKVFGMWKKSPENPMNQVPQSTK